MPFIIFLVFAAIVTFIGLRYRMLKQMMIMLACVAVVLGIIGYSKYKGYQAFMAMKSGMASMKQTISTAKATSSDWSQEMRAVGSIRAEKGVDLSNELDGIVEEINFRSGDDVKQGTLLIKQRAEDDVAKLASLQASSKLAQINYARDKKQLAVQAISQATLDADAATLASARAQVAQQQAIVDKKFIRAPFSGHLGIRNVDVGQYIKAGTNIVTLQQLDPIYLDFDIPQQALAQVKPGQAIAVKNDTYPDRVFHGQIAAINPKVDTATRNVSVRAELTNADHALLPGMYATAKISVGTPEKFVTVPQTAITYNPYGNTVYVVHHKDKSDKPIDEKDQDLVVEQSFVTVGETRGDQVQVLKGLKDGDIVVSAGQIKLQNGAAIDINNSVTPKNDANPHPVE